MAERAEVYQIREVAHDQDRYRDDRVEDNERVFASAADAQAVCDQINEPRVRNLLATQQNSYERQVTNRLDALAANEILRAGGSAQRLNIPPIPSDPPNREAILKRLSDSDGWLYVEPIELVPASRPEPEVCHFCALEIHEVTAEGGTWLVDSTDAAVCLKSMGDGHARHSEWVTANQLREQRGLPPLP
jgi:hypothetical protein